MSIGSMMSNDAQAEIIANLLTLLTVKENMATSMSSMVSILSTLFQQSRQQFVCSMCCL